MAKKKNVNKGKNQPKTEIVIREKTDISHEDYYTADQDKVQKQKKQDAPKHQGPSLRKHYIRVAAILLLAILALVLWINRNNFSPENFTTWFKTKLMGTGVGDGYPVLISGSGADSGNFLDYEGNSIVLSDTSLTMLNSTGREILYFPHSYNNPAMSAVQGRFLIYNVGGTGYSIVSAGNDYEKKTAPDKLSAAALAKNGRYALVTQPSDYASRLNVYLPSGTLKFTYQFADAYISAVAMNDDGTQGVVSALQSENGQLYSKLYLFDFNQDTPTAEFYSANNMIMKVGYTGRNSICAVGDKKAVFCSASREFTEFDYQGKNLTAVKMENHTALVSISSYTKGGPCTVLIFSDSAEPLQIQTEDWVTDLSVNENVFAALIGDYIYSYDVKSGTVLGTGLAGYDAKGISLVNERDVYVLGVREIRYLSLQAPKASPAGDSEASSEAPTPATAQPSPSPTPLPKAESTNSGE